ncbi:MAG: SGNH/GDSL hydrolase family protein [Planctomycetes bacterium]|nr:SGNH/GDSL hydrolase family protein [Planctomycetota bacterium]
MRRITIISLIVVSWSIMLVPIAGAVDDAIRNGDFSSGPASWDGIAATDDHQAGIIDLDGRKALRLVRSKPDAAVGVTQYNVRFKPQTRYRLSVVGSGGGPAVVSLRLQSSKDPEFDKLAKSWATSTCPMPASQEPVMECLVIDTGLVPDSAFLSLRLDGSAPCSYTFRSVSLIELGSSKPDPKHIVVAHLGDSITITSYLPFSQRIDALLADQFMQKVPDRIVHHINLAADGEWVADLLDSKRYEKVVKANLQKIDIAVIRYGANDQRKKASPADFKTDVATLCDRLTSDYPGISIVLGTGPYLPGNADINKQYGAHWQVLRDLAKERSYLLADIHQRFEREGNAGVFRGPGDMHPGPLGVRLAAEEEFPVLQKLIEQRATKP